MNLFDTVNEHCRVAWSVIVQFVKWRLSLFWESYSRIAII